MLKQLDVYIWSCKAGTLVASKGKYKEQICFYFDPDFVRLGIDMAPLRAPVNGIAAKNTMPVYPESSRGFHGLPSFIADSMPDHWGNVLFAEWAAANNIRMRDLSPLDRLAYIGRRGMGALEFVPPSAAELENPFRVGISELSELAQQALSDAKRFHANMNPVFEIASLFKVGTSAGGRRPKAVINVNPQTGECFSGQVPAPAPGFVPMIVKFDEHADVPTTRIEYSYYLMAMDAGIGMMPSELYVTENEAHFLTRRFDRKGDEKIHVQTLAAMNPYASSYNELFEVAVRIGIAPAEIKQLFLLMVMNVVGGNVDDHNKNFSFIMNKDGEWHTSPAYDLTFSVDPSGPSYVNRHSMDINGKNQDITRADLLEVATGFNIKGASSLIDKIVGTAIQYRKYALKAGVPEMWINLIEQEISHRISIL